MNEAELIEFYSNRSFQVKKVLEPDNCGAPREGDYLLAVDGIDLRNLNHSKVIQVLEEIPKGTSSVLTIRRTCEEKLCLEELTHSVMSTEIFRTPSTLQMYVNGTSQALLLMPRMVFPAWTHDYENPEAEHNYAAISE